MAGFYPFYCLFVQISEHRNGNNSISVLLSRQLRNIVQVCGLLNNGAQRCESKKNYFSVILEYSVLVDKNVIFKEFCCIVVSIHSSLFVLPVKLAGM